MYCINISMYDMHPHPRRTFFHAFTLDVYSPLNLDVVCENVNATHERTYKPKSIQKTHLNKIISCL